MINVYHLKRLTETERNQLNAPDGGWDSNPRFARYADITTRGKPAAVRQALDLGEYKKVATVDTDDTERAFELTNHINQAWTENTEVVAASGDHRSSSVGDLVQTDDGQVYLVANMGFELILVPKLSQRAV